MQSRFMIERTTGVAMLLLVPLAVASAVTGLGVAGTDPYFGYDFPRFARQMDGHALQLTFQFAFAAALIPTAAMHYIAFRPHFGRFATFSAIALLASAALMTAAAVAGVRLHTLAEVWNDGGARGDAVWRSARPAALLAGSLTFAGIVAFAASFATFGVLIALKAPLPSALGLATLAGAVLVVLGAGAYAMSGKCPPGCSGAAAMWRVMTLGVLEVMLSLVATGGWLLVRGIRRAPRPASGAD